VESSYPSQGCALTGRPCTQKRTQLGRQKPAVQQWSQRQSRPELVDIQPTPGPECLFGAIGKDTYSAPVAIARALLRLFQSSAAERSHYFGVQPNPSSVKKQVKFAVFSNQEFRCSPAEPDVCTDPQRSSAVHKSQRPRTTSSVSLVMRRNIRPIGIHDPNVGQSYRGRPFPGHGLTKKQSCVRRASIRLERENAEALMLVSSVAPEPLMPDPKPPIFKLLKCQRQPAHAANWCLWTVIRSCSFRQGLKLRPMSRSLVNGTSVSLTFGITPKYGIGYGEELLSSGVRSTPSHSSTT
jgi:hypothetical protein